VSAWLSGSSAMAAIAKPMPRPIAMISRLQPRHRPHLARGRANEPQEPQLSPAPEGDHDERVDNGDRGEGEDLRDELRPKPTVHPAVGVCRGRQGRAVAHPQSGVPRSECLQTPGHDGGVVGLDEDRSQQWRRLVACCELWGEQGVAEGEVATVDRDDGGVGACAVAEHDAHAVADVGAGGISAVAPERDRVAVQRAERPGGHAGVDTTGLSSGQDLGGDRVTGFAEAGAECGGGEGHGGAHPGRRAHARGSAAAGTPGPVLVRASWPVRLAWRCSWIACSSVVVLNRRVQLRATVRTSGVLAEEKRRVAAPRFADARKPPTGASAASGGASSRAPRWAAIGPRRPTATTRKMAVL
jgi:hypothetical protein